MGRCKVVGALRSNGLCFCFSGSSGHDIIWITEQLDFGKSAIKTGDKKSAISAKMKETIIAYLTDHTEAKAASIAEYIGLKPSRTRDYLNELVAEGVVVVQGGNRNRTYRLKS